jgi:threonine synthase
MWPWESTPHSVAYGIVDDVTYDWLGVVEGMLRSGGATVTVGEDDLRAANELARRHTAIDVDHTGSAGLAGLMRALARSSVIRGDHTVVVLFTGIRRS